MNSSKTAQLLMVAHNYITSGKPVFLIKPKIDNRFSENYIVSRAVERKKVDLLINPKCDNLWGAFSGKRAVLVDEAQFLSEKNVDALRDLTKSVPVVCYGLRTDYRGKLFPGSKRLMEIADSIEEIKTVCNFCEKKAILNAKFKIVNEKKVIIKEGTSDPDLGAENKYMAMCWECWTN